MKATKDDQEKLRAWADTWKKTGAILENINRETMREASLPETIPALTDACESALRFYPPPPPSGLIEMQKVFSRLRKNETNR